MVISLILVFAILLISGCSCKPESAPPPKSDLSGVTDSQDDNQVSSGVVGLALSTLNNPFFVDLRDGAQESASNAGVNLIILDAQNDAAKQLANIENLIQQKVSVIIVNPVDSKAVIPAIEAANRANIPVITVDRNADGGKVVAAIASDNVEGGRMAGKYIVEKLQGQGMVAEIEGIPGTSAANDRGKGFNEIIQKATGIKVVSKQPADFDRAKGLKVMENILQANPEINAVFAHNDEMALGAVEAIKANGKNIIVVGFDATPDAIKSVKAGVLGATVAQKPKELGRVAVETAQNIMNNKSVENNIPVGLELIIK